MLNFNKAIFLSKKILKNEESFTFYFIILFYLYILFCFVFENFGVTRSAFLFSLLTFFFFYHSCTSIYGSSYFSFFLLHVRGYSGALVLCSWIFGRIRCNTRRCPGFTPSLLSSFWFFSFVCFRLSLVFFSLLLAVFI